MSVELRWEQCCETAGCTKPALHGVLCAPCFYAAGPARRAVELLGAEPLAPPARPSSTTAAWSGWRGSGRPERRTRVAIASHRRARRFRSLSGAMVRPRASG